ncbi:hypothetical protein BOX15_Mlig020172g4 [Macrostomum lignano]|uniref:Uncharacterized protein n=2 Tax=Macrostomum lignano TaxID=282301 RepID=A0A267ECU0_9PLAT|nr:hypothetical protein BOX15_Mlig020172g2 [Macrostomum lignano]PAA93703.1 hypothetical protein BOX15_Mlig020172g4 [Macrostomum lignano]
MACVTLKRSLDHEASSVTSAKRRRFHHCGSRSPPSPDSSTMSPGSAGSSSIANACGALTSVPPPAAPSNVDQSQDFPASRLPPELLSQRLTAEIRRLQRRRLIPSAAAAAASAPNGGGSGGDSEMPTATVAAALCTHCGASAVKAGSASSSPGSSLAGPSGEPALFTLSQVQSIAEKLLSEREQQIRTEFQALLSAKLQEQYDAFLRFNHDQIYRMHSGAPMSYVS